MRGELSTEQLWKMFGEYENNVYNSINPEYGLMNATMANAIASLLVIREQREISDVYR